MKFRRGRCAKVFGRHDRRRMATVTRRDRDAAEVPGGDRPFAVAVTLIVPASSMIATDVSLDVYFAQRVTSSPRAVAEMRDDLQLLLLAGLQHEHVEGCISIRIDPRIARLGARRARGDPFGENRILRRVRFETARRPCAERVRSAFSRIRLLAGSAGSIRRPCECRVIAASRRRRRSRGAKV